MKSVRNIVSVTCSQLKISLRIRLHPAAYKNQAQSELCTKRWRIAWCFSITVSLCSRHFYAYILPSIFLIKKSSVTQKNYWVSIKQTVSQVMLHKQLNKTQKKKKCCVTIKKVMLHKKKTFMSTWNILCCTGKK